MGKLTVGVWTLGSVVHIWNVDFVCGARPGSNGLFVFKGYSVCVCVCVCVCARARACVSVYVCMCVCMCVFYYLFMILMSFNNCQPFQQQKRDL